MAAASLLTRSQGLDGRAQTRDDALAALTPPSTPNTGQTVKLRTRVSNANGTRTGSARTLTLLEPVV